MPQMTTAEAIVASLIAHGLDTIYALPGVQNDHLFDALFKASDQIRTVHTRHEQGAAYMALGAALATGKPQAYAVVPGPGLLNASAALLTAYGMNAQVLALVGQIPHATSAAASATCTRSAIRPASSRGSSIIRRWSAAPRWRRVMVAEAFRAMATGRPGPAALECAIDVWGKPGEVTPHVPLPVEQPAIDEDALRDAAKRLGAAKNLMIVVGGGAQDASPEVTRLAEMLQAPVFCGFRRGQGVLDSRNPLPVTLPLGHELWGEADVVLAVGTRLFFRAHDVGRRRSIDIIAVNADPEEPGKHRKPAVALIGDAAPILRRLMDVLPAQNRRRRPRKDEMQERHAKWAKRLAKLDKQIAILEAIRAELPGERHFRRRGDAGRLRGAPRHAGLQAAHVPLARLSGQSRLGLCHRARRAGCAARRAGAVDQRRRRLHVHGKRNGDRGAPPHSAGRDRVRGRRVRQCAPHPGGELRQPADRVRPRQSGFREIRRKLSARLASACARQRNCAARSSAALRGATARR